MYITANVVFHTITEALKLSSYDHSTKVLNLGALILCIKTQNIISKV